MHNLGRARWNIVKHIFRYLVGMDDFRITFAPDKPSSLVGYTDLNYKGYLNNQKSTSRYCFMFGHGSISWRSKIQECTAMSTTEVEYIATSDAAKEAFLLGRIAVTF